MAHSPNRGDRNLPDPAQVYPNDPRADEKPASRPVPGTEAGDKDQLDYRQGIDDGGEGIIEGMPRETGGERDHQEDPDMG